MPRFLLPVTLFVLTVWAIFLPENASAKESSAIVLVALGDSLTAGYGLPPKDSFPYQLNQALKKKKYHVQVRGAGVSGDTSAAGLARLDWSVRKDASAVIVEFGGNDALRGISPQQTYQNMRTIIERLQKRNIPILLAGMQAPRNLGKKYKTSFDDIFPRLAREYDLVYYPFFLKDVAGKPDLNISDRIHPNREGIAVIVRNIMPYVEKLIQRVNRKN